MRWLGSVQIKMGVGKGGAKWHWEIKATGSYAILTW